MVVKSEGGSGAKEGAAGAAVRRWVEAGGGRLVLDGGLATELEAHGADLNDPLWSAKCILSSPHLIRKASRRRPNTSCTLMYSAHRHLGLASSAILFSFG